MDAMEMLRRCASPRRLEAVDLLISTLTEAERARLRALLRGWRGDPDDIPRRLVRECLDHGQD
jgi:hypothetical protein